jgi:hypothetical protein
MQIRGHEIMNSIGPQIQCAFIPSDLGNHCSKPDPTPQLHMILPRVFGGVMGGLLILGAAFATFEATTRILVGSFGLTLVLIATFAKEKTIERWFGGF